MIDLHLHLDGSLSVDTILNLSKMQGINMPSQNKDILKKYLSAPADCKDLNEYLSCFELPLSLLQSGQYVEYATEKLCMELLASGLEYAEIRFAPQLHTRNGSTQRHIIEAACRGVKNSDFNAGIILCCMRGRNNDNENRETVKLASEYIGNGVVAVDLAGAEALYKTNEYKDLFDYCRKLNIPFTIHAGEADGADSVKAAIEMGASRIGHGIRAAEDGEVMKLLAENNIPVEMCFTSNMQTKAITEPKQWPLRKFMSAGICVTINTDNITVSDTTLEREYELIEEYFQLTKEELEILKNNAKKASFNK
ncbi:MAG: adenosine deaminase [Eubacterium sp.]